MDQKQIDILTKKIADQTISDAEFQQYYDWLTTDDGQPLEILGASSKVELENRIYSKIADHTGIAVHPRTIKMRLWPRIGIAAAVATIIFGAGLFYYNLKDDKAQSSQIALKNDIAPGKQGATLTLANGKRIKLSDAANGELAKEAGVMISKSANGQLIYEVKGSKSESNKINTLSTAKGETYQLRLPDGSLVWLNAASSLSYPANFIGDKNRRVKLEGEGYFEIAKDKSHPFIVETRRQKVEVLGTHFNVSSYNDEPNTKTTLLEGSVNVSTLSGLRPSLPEGESRILKPGQQSVLSGSNRLSVSNVNVDKAVAWKNGKFIFEEEDIESIMKKLSRWYNVEVIYQGDFSNRTFVGSISRSDNISKILEKITFTQAVHFKIEGRRIYVMP